MKISAKKSTTEDSVREQLCLFVIAFVFVIMQAQYDTQCVIALQSQDAFQCTNREMMIDITSLLIWVIVWSVILFSFNYVVCRELRNCVVCKSGLVRKGCVFSRFF